MSLDARALRALLEETCRAYTGFDKYSCMMSTAVEVGVNNRDMNITKKLISEALAMARRELRGRDLMDLEELANIKLKEAGIYYRRLRLTQGG